MKKQLTFIFLFVLSLSYAQQKIVGHWLFLELKTDSKTENPFVITDFTKDGQIKIMNNPFGNWHKSNNKYLLNFTKPDFNGLYSAKTNKDILTLSGDNYTLIFQKIDPKSNEKLPVLGIWKLQNPDRKLYLQLDLPNLVTSVEVLNENGMITSKGTWLYSPKENKIRIIGFMDDLQGVNKITTIKKDYFSFKKDSVTLLFNRVEKANPKFLSVKESDFEDEVDYSSKLPWQDDFLIFDNFKNIKELIYNKKTFLVDIEAFDKEKMLQKININDENILVTNYLIHNDTIKLNTVRKGGLDNRYNRFFPQKEFMDFKVIGKEQVTVPAGKFTCTVVVGLDYDTMVKYYLIDDKPGIIAKIIEQKIDDDQSVISYDEMVLENINYHSK